MIVSNVAPVNSPVITTAERVDDYTVMSVSWNALSNCDSRGELLGYKIRWGVDSTRDSDPTPTPVSVSADTTTIILPGGDNSLTVYDQYYVEIAAENYAGLGPYSNVTLIPREHKGYGNHLFIYLFIYLFIFSC